MINIKYIKYWDVISSLDGNLSSKLAYEHMLTVGSQFDWCKLIWNKFIPLELLFFEG